MISINILIAENDKFFLNGLKRLADCDIILADSVTVVSLDHFNKYAKTYPDIIINHDKEDLDKISTSVKVITFNIRKSPECITEVIINNENYKKIRGKLILFIEHHINDLTHFLI